VPLVLLERSWWAGFDGIYLVTFGFRMWEILKWFLPLKMQINSRNQVFLEGKISRGRCNSCAKGTGHTTSVYHICSLLNKQKPNEKQKKIMGKKEFALDLQSSKLMLQKRNSGLVEHDCLERGDWGFRVFKGLLYMPVFTSRLRTNGHLGSHKFIAAVWRTSQFKLNPRKSYRKKFPAYLGIV
jgi:hypothetical protein